MPILITFYIQVFISYDTDHFNHIPKLIGDVIYERFLQQSIYGLLKIVAQTRGWVIFAVKM